MNFTEGPRSATKESGHPAVGSRSSGVGAKEGVHVLGCLQHGTGYGCSAAGGRSIGHREAV